MHSERIQTPDALHILLPYFQKSFKLGKSVKNKFLFTMTAYLGQNRKTLGQLCATLWDSQSRPNVMQPGFEPGTAVTPLALRCSASDRCATREPIIMITLTLTWYIIHCLELSPGLSHACMKGPCVIEGEYNVCQRSLIDVFSPTCVVHSSVVTVMWQSPKGAGKQPRRHTEAYTHNYKQLLGGNLQHNAD